MYWYASVNYGLEDIICEILKSHGAENIKTFDSALVYSCQKEINLRCIVNLFIVLSTFRSGNIIDSAKKLSKERFRFPRLNGRSFRIVIMDCGKLRPLPGNIMDKLENNILQQTRLSVNRANPDIEIWLNRKNDNTVYFMLRVRKRTPFDKTLKKGELRPDIVEVMLHKAGINNQCTVVDLFGGWGSIAASVTESGKYKKVYTGDINSECVNYQISRLRGKRDCIVKKWNALMVPLEEASTDAIVTDPPWGEYTKLNIPELYDGFIKESARILSPGGFLVFLSSAWQASCQSLEKYRFSYSYIPLKINGKETYLFCSKRSLR